MKMVWGMGYEVQGPFQRLVWVLIFMQWR